MCWLVPTSAHVYLIGAIITTKENASHESNSKNNLYFLTPVFLFNSSSPFFYVS